MDKEFIDNFFINYSKENIYHVDLQKFFKKLKGYRLVMNYNNLDEFEKGVLENPFLEMLINEFAPEINFVPDLMDKLTNIDFYIVDNYPFKLFFVDGSEKTNTKASLNFGYEFISSSDIDKKWKNYYSERNDKKMKVTKNRKYPEDLRFDSYEKLKEFGHPLNSIIIIDRYVLINKKGTQEITDNLIPLLKALINNIPEKLKIELLILTRNFELDIKSTWEFLIKELEKEFPGIDMKLGIVRDEKKLYPKGHHGIKGRRIITNYLTIKSEDSFNYFNSNGSTKGISDITIDFNFDNQQWQDLQFELSEIRHYIDKLKEYDNIDLTHYNTKKNRLLSN